MDDTIPTPRNTAGNEPLTVLQRIELKDAKEGFLKGAAEVFAIVSGVGKDGKAHVVVRRMPFLTASGQPRTPYMDLIHWTEFASSFVNIHLYERDGDLDCNKLARTLIGSVGDIASLFQPGGTATGGALEDAAGAILSVATGKTATALRLVSKIGEAVLDSMGTSWLVDDHDYLDSFYTIERGEYYKDRLGAARNARVTLKPQMVG